MNRFIPTLAALLIAVPGGAQTPGDVPADAALRAAQMPAWVPAELTLPEDARITAESAVGSLLRLATVEVPGNPDGLMSGWRKALHDAGYAVEDPGDTLIDAPIVFSGQGIRTGQIVRLPGTSDAVTLIQIDVTLDG